MEIQIPSSQLGMRSSRQSREVHQLSLSYSFRHIRPEEGDQIARIEQVCFSPETAISPEVMKKRAAEIPDMFLAAVVNSGKADPGAAEASCVKANPGAAEAGCVKANPGIAEAGCVKSAPGAEKIAGYITALATDEETFRDAFFESPSLHDPDGSNVMLLGLEVLPEYRHQGLAGELLNRSIRKAKEEGRKKLVLTCEKDKIAMYQKFGFQLCGISRSRLGGVTWYEMDYRL